MKNIFQVLKPRKKIHIFYKHVHSATGKNRPSWFTHEACFLNLLRSIAYSKKIPLDINLTVLFDGTQESYDCDFIRIYNEKSSGDIVLNEMDFKLEIYQGGSQRLAGLHLLERASRGEYRQGDYIYLLENDYIHDYAWAHFFYQLITSDVLFDYISLYDHSDKYPFRKGFHEMHKNLMSKIYVAGGRHWRSVPSTCYSFIVSAKKFKEDIDILKSDLMDHQMFDELGKKGRIVLSPIPGLATHCMTNLLSPCVDWEKFLLPIPASQWEA